LIRQLSDRLENARNDQTRGRRIIGRDERSFLVQDPLNESTVPAAHDSA
jgi:hypothetical protein